MLLFEVLARTGALLYWVHSGHQLADALTKIASDCRDTLATLLELFHDGKVRITYDTASYRKALQREKATLERLDYQNLHIDPEDPSDCDVPASTATWRGCD